MTKKELAIIGAGVSGCSASLYAKRSGLDFFLFEEKTIGGQLFLIEEIENYPGIERIKGYEFAKRLEKMVQDLGIEVRKERVVKLEIKEKEILLRSNKESYLFKGVIVATGSSFKKLGIKGEEEFLGKGVSFCAVCDGYFFKEKVVCVVGGGNSACEEAIYLSQIAKKVFLIHRRDKLRAIDYLQKKIFKKDNIEILFNKTVKEIKGTQIVEEIILEDVEKKEISSLKTSAVFVAIGTKPNTEFLKGIVSLDEKGFIITDEEMRTSLEFIWACGDCRKRPLRQLITASSEGAISAFSAYKYLKGQYISS
jgi:thioredoxin reductase (NADPH)